MLHRFKLINILIFILGCLVLLTPLINLYDFYPIFDGGWLLTSVLGSADHSLNWRFLNWGDHDPAFFYLGLLAIPQYLFGFNILWIHLVNFLLLLLFLYGVFALSGLTTTDTSKRERVLFTLAVASIPAIWASVFNPSLNFGAMVFGTWLLIFFMRNKEWGILFAGTALCFSQETGILVYALSSVVYALTLFFKTYKKRIKLLKVFYKLFIAAIPGILLILYTVFSENGSSLTNGKANTLCWTQKTGWLFFFSSNCESKSVQNYVFNIFILNFQSIFTLLILVTTSFCLIKLITKRINITKDNFSSFSWIFIVFVIWLYAITRCPLFNNPKYVLACISLLPSLAFALTVYALTSQHTLRCVLWVVIIAVLQASIWSSIDPLAKRYYGTFSFGKHEMYKMTSTSNECCGYGIDQLLYNLEFTNIHYITNQIVKDLKDKNLLVLATSLLSWTLDHFDSEGNRKLRPKEHLQLVANEPKFIITKPEITELAHIEYPFFSNSDAIKLIEQDFELKNSALFERDGYNYKVNYYQRKHTNP